MVAQMTRMCQLFIILKFNIESYYNKDIIFTCEGY